MKTTFGQLLKLEWHERKWAFALGLAWVGLTVVYAMIYEQLILPMRMPIGSLHHNIIWFGMIAAIFLAIKTVFGERMRGTLGFSASLPVSMRWQALIRVLGGMTVIVISIALAAAIFATLLAIGLMEQSVWPAPRIKFQSMLRSQACSLTGAVALVGAASTVEFYLLMCLIGTVLRNERTLAFIGV
jgi:hypothetical protein